MCGRYFIDDQTAAEMNRFIKELDRQLSQNTGHGYGPALKNDPAQDKADAPIRQTSNGHFQKDIHPFERAVVLYHKGRHIAGGLMTWGFPGCAQRSLLINARSESAFEKKLSVTASLTAGVLFLPRAFTNGIPAKKKVPFPGRISRSYGWAAALIS